MNTKASLSNFIYMAGSLGTAAKVAKWIIISSKPEELVVWRIEAGWLASKFPIFDTFCLEGLTLLEFLRFRQLNRFS